MKNKQLFEKAYSRLTELYASDYTTPDIVVLNRFYQEKMILGESELYMRFLDFIGKVRAIAEQRGEHIFVRGTTGSSFIHHWNTTPRSTHDDYLCEPEFQLPKNPA